MKTNQKRLLARLMAPVALGGIVWTLTNEKPLQAQNTGLAAPPKIEQAAEPDDQGCDEAGDERGPRRRSQAGDNERGRGGQGRGQRAGRGQRGERGPADEMDDDFGPPRGRARGGGEGEDEDFGGPPPRGPRRGGPDGPGDEFGPPPGGMGGPRGMGGPGGEFGPPPPGRGGPRDEMGFGGPPGRGPRDGGPGGPEGRGPGGRGGEIGRAAHAIADVDVFDKLTGDAFNVSGQAREYYRRALNARKEGKAEDARKYAIVADELARAAVRLAEVQTGQKLPELMGGPGFDGPGPGGPGFDGPGFGGPGPQGERPKPDAARLKEHAGHVLNDAYRALGETKGQWNDTARKLYSQARASYDAGKYEEAIGQGCAVLHLTRAGRQAG